MEKYDVKKLGPVFRASIEDEENELRGKFVKDRDKILYSKAFRRLVGKTQVFLSGDDDHVRNRLTHTIEVSQIARTISKALGLNEELTEAIALGHDLGHTPFGHVGERTLNFIMCGCDEIKDFNSKCLSNQKGFKHNWQGLRVITDLESSSNGEGLKLSEYTMWGILNHSSTEYKNKDKCKYKLDNICTLRRCGKECVNGTHGDLSFYKSNEYYKQILEPKNLTIEALIVALADEIAQRQHDIEDALETKIVEFDELYEKIKETYGKEYEEFDKKIFEEKDKETQISKLNSFLLDFLILDAIENIKKNLNDIAGKQDNFEKYKFSSYKENNEKDLRKSINLSKKTSDADKEFQEFISKRVLNSHKAQSMDGKGNYIIRQLFKAYVTNPQQLPDKTIKRLFKNIEVSINKDEKINKQEKDSIKEILKENFVDLNKVGELRNVLENLHSSGFGLYKASLMRTICDYIAGMTDRYAMKLYSDLYQTH